MGDHCFGSRARSSREVENQRQCRSGDVAHVRLSLNPQTWASRLNVLWECDFMIPRFQRARQCGEQKVYYSKAHIHRMQYIRLNLLHFEIGDTAVRS